MKTRGLVYSLVVTLCLGAAWANGQVTIHVSRDGFCGGHNPCYSTIQDAIDSVSLPSILKITQETYHEDVVLDVNQMIALEGGWDTSFTSCSSYTIINGSLTIADGTMTIGGIGRIILSTPPPTINSFSANPGTVNSGQSSTLSWSITNATSASIDQGVGSVNSAGGSIDVSPATTTTYTLTATNAMGSDMAQVTVTVIPIPPTINSLSVNPDTIDSGQSSTLSWTITNATSASIDQGIGSVNPSSGSVTVTPVSNTKYTLTATNSFRSVTAQVSVTVTDGIPPDPKDVAPPIDPTVATTVFSSTQFLYTGPDPIQTGVAPGTIDPKRAAVLRGKVLDRNNNPLYGVMISILNHPEFGQTLSRADGMYDMVVNGGGPLILNYVKAGRLAAQRTVNVPWQDWLVVDDLVIVERDPVGSVIDSSLNTYQAHLATPVTDGDGARRATLLFPPGTTATPLEGAPLGQFTVRATEYTVGPLGPKAMPAILPPTSAYTYAVELSLDGVDGTVNFSQPVQYYLENFLGFPVGTHVPTGYYDPAKAAWIAIPDGRVVKIVAETSGVAEVDTDGDGIADNAGLSEAERTLLASLYEPDAELWRVELSHFSWVDMNFAYGLSSGAEKPIPTNIDIANNAQSSSGPIQGFGALNPANQTMTERIDLVGIPFKLHYASQRVPDGLQGISIPLTGATLPPDLQKIFLNINVAGRNFAYSFGPQPNLVYDFSWDGRDVYGRRTYGGQPITVQIGYVYPNYYYTPWGQIPVNELVASFARLGLTPFNIRAREATSVLWSEPTTFIGQPKSVGTLDPRGAGLGGWTLSPHHAYDFQRRAVHMGDGTVRQDADGFGAISHVAGIDLGDFTQGFGDGGLAKLAQFSRVGGMAVAQDGTLYVSDSIDNRVRKIDLRTGIITHFAGSGQERGDGEPATVAQLSNPTGLSIAPDGSLYIAETGNCRIRRVDPQGIISTVAGDTCNGEWGDNGPATATNIGCPIDVAVAPDGSFYISTDATYTGIRHVGTDGIITSINALNSWGYPLNGKMALGPDGSLYVAIWQPCKVYRVGTDGAVSTVAGTGECSMWNYNPPEGIPATQAMLEYPAGIAVTSNGVLYIVEEAYYQFGYTDRIRRIGTDGIITSIIPFTGNLTIPQAHMGSPDAVKLAQAVVATGPDGRLYFSSSVHPVGEGEHGTVGMLRPVLPGYDGTEIIVPSPRGDLLYVFNGQGRHLETRHALTNSVLLSFGYDEEGHLSRVTDIDGNITWVERDGAGNPTGLVGPYGQRTTLAVNGDGWLSGVTSPGGNSWHLSYGGPGGLLTQVTTPRSSVYRFEYDSKGRLTKATDADNAETRLSLSKTVSSYDVTVTSPGGIATVYRTEYLPSGEERHTTLLADSLYELKSEFPNFSRRLIRPDGTQTTVELGPDPRFGMQAAYVKKATTSRPGGPTTMAELSRTATLSDPDNLFSLQQLVEATTLNGKTSTASYDAPTRTFACTSAAGRQSVSQIDASGRILNAQSGGLEATAFAYDSRGRLGQVIQGSRTTHYTYGADGLLGDLTDSLGRIAQFDRDPDGRIVTQWLADNRSIGYAYDAGGLPTSLTPPAGAGYTFTWTPLGLLDVTTLPDGQTTDVDYNLDRQITVQRLPGSPLNLGYDAAGRLTTQDLGGGAVIVTGYGADGRPASLSTPGQSLGFTWAGGLLTSETWTGLVNGSVTATFDSFLRRALQTVNGSASIAFSYDDDGLRTGAGDPVDTSIGIGITRDPSSGLITATGIGWVSDTYGYDSFGELASYAADFGGSSLYAATLTRDNAGRITGKDETVQGVMTRYDYSYDVPGRLTAYSVNGTPVTAYAYDDRNNRTDADDVAAVYDAGDRLTSQGATQYSYDANGRLASATVGTGQPTVYGYDPLGRLLSADPPGPDNAVSYDYDGAGRRIRQSVNGVVTHGWIYQDGIRPAAELDESGNVISRFVYASRLVTPDYMIRSGAYYRLITDERGSVRLVVNVDDGNIAQRIDYDPWGRVAFDSNPGFQPFGFAGGLYDPATGMVRFGVRDYDPESGRFTAPDPLYLAGGQFNLYAYVSNDPINWIDPTGMVNWGLVYRGTGRILGGTGGAITGVALTGGTLGVGAIPGLALFGGGIYTAGSGAVDLFNGLFEVDPNLPNPGSVPALIGYGVAGEKGQTVGDIVDMVAGLVAGGVAKGLEKAAEKTGQVVMSAPGWLSSIGDAFTFIDSNKTIIESRKTIMDAFGLPPDEIKTPLPAYSMGAIMDSGGHINHQ
jgi:RHS repeat-associated protein